ncbi:right-handed parallel beta-helix repeat-containing protein [Nocardioides pantholopis]|uniref:right-handed parallel beta-helix repeat-containing protein n=1 Tax=Nocardioides pantholopis TaxID=2483798 RepID=UPI0013DE3471|nr:right-handed parallel beta-helix repeat-containing protein [Nocardioides pantholopis]
MRTILVTLLLIAAGGIVAPVTPAAAAPVPAERQAQRLIAVRTSAGLTAALARARPGDVIELADGTYTSEGTRAPLALGGQHYSGTFVASASGTARRPIVLTGSRRAVIDGDPGGDGTGTRYGLYLAGAAHWEIRGITVRNVAKGIVLDRSRRNLLRGLAVHTTGEEGIHLRASSRHNTVRGSVVRRTGLVDADSGEGIYVGSARSNWHRYSGGRRDASDHNRILGNRIRRTAAESIDVKEGTRLGLLRGNVLDGAGMRGAWADSWVDVKGNRWRVERNRGTRAAANGFEVHVAARGWGRHNVFSRNIAVVRAAGHGFWVQHGARGTRIRCDNVVRRARAGFANVRCS